MFVFHMPYMVFHFYSVQAAVMQMQMSEAELSELSHTREPPSKKGSDKHSSRVSVSMFLIAYLHMALFGDFYYYQRLIWRDPELATAPLSKP